MKQEQPNMVNEAFGLTKDVFILSGTEKEQVIKEAVEKLVEINAIPAGKKEEVVEALLRREELGSTGIGRGVALPHARIDCIEHPVAIVARCPGGIDFDALDGQPVEALIFIFLPKGDAAEGMKLMVKIAEAVRDPVACRLLMQVEQVEEVIELIEQSSRD